MKQGELFACEGDVNRLFSAVLHDMEKQEFMNITVKRAKSIRCAVNGCKKVAIYKILIQYFPHISNESLR